MRAVAAVAAAVVLGGCASGASGRVTVGDIGTVADEQRTHPYGFSITERAPDGQALFGVDGLVDDDYRYRVAVVLAGRPSYEEVVDDDARYVRALAPDTLPAGWRDDARLAPVVAGQWVVDPAGAPAEFHPPAAAPLSPAFALSAVRTLERLGDTVRRAGRRVKWNPNSSTYLEKNDKFPRHDGDGERFDFLPADFNPDVVFKDGIPSDAAQIDAIVSRYFLYTSVWVRAHRVTRIEMLLDVPPSYDRGLRRAVRVVAQRTGQRPEQIQIPAALHLRPYRRTYRFRGRRAGERFEVPSGAITLPLPPAGTTS